MTARFYKNMLNNKTPSFDRSVYILVLGYSFFYGGLLQFFIGLSNTGVTIIFTLLLLIIYFHSAYYNGKVIVNIYILTSTLALLLILVSSLINSTPILRLILYTITVLLPLTIYLNERKREMSGHSTDLLKRVLLVLALVQFPIILIQRSFYDVFMQFNQSSQNVALIDFGFGTFLLKDDHALGFFLISNFLFVALNKELHLSKLVKLFALTILTITILMLNSKVSLLLFLISLVYVFYRKSGFLRVTNAFKVNKRYWFIILSILLVFIIFNAQPRYYSFFKNQVSMTVDYESALSLYNAGKAKRGHIINVWLHEDIRWFGEGPYSYFNIEEGGFSSSNINFSQWLWVYHDLGMFGILLFVSLFISMARTFKEKKNDSNILSFFLFIYAFFAIVMFDISFMLIYFIYKRNNGD